MRDTHSISLIGMPAAGKSTLGVMLAKRLGKDFVDIDVAIQVREGKTLQAIVDESGYQELRRVEELALLEGSYLNKVVATGGSAVYSDAGMQRLKQLGTVIYLDTPLEQLASRLSDYETRGIARRPDQSFEDLYSERAVLYKQYADVTLDCSSGTADQILNALLTSLGTISENFL